jgi:hypothetical protein
MLLIYLTLTFYVFSKIILTDRYGLETVLDFSTTILQNETKFLTFSISTSLMQRELMMNLFSDFEPYKNIS